MSLSGIQYPYPSSPSSSIGDMGYLLTLFQKNIPDYHLGNDNMHARVVSLASASLSVIPEFPYRGYGFHTVPMRFRFEVHRDDGPKAIDIHDRTRMLRSKQK